MNSIKLIILLFLVSNTYGQTKEFNCRLSHANNDLKFYNLKGKVKSIKEISFKAKRRNEETGEYEFVKPEIKDTITFVKDIYFNKQGRITQIKTNVIIEGVLRAKGYLERKCKYTPSGEIKNISFYDVLGGKVEDRRFEKDGLKKSMYVSSWENNFKDAERRKIFTYDNKGNIVKENTLSERGFFWEKNITFRYNDDNNRIRRTISDKEGNIVSRLSYVYDLKGDMVGSVFVKKNGFKVIDNVVHKYYHDNQGNLIKKTNNSYGDDKFTYKYDAKGNWYTREKSFIRGIVKQKTIHEITYYDEPNSYKLVDYKKGRVTMDTLSGKIVNIINPEKIIFRESGTGEKIILRLAFVKLPKKDANQMKKMVAFMKEQVINKKVKVILFNFNPAKSSCPAAFVNFYNEVTTYGIKGDVVVINTITIRTARQLNKEVILNGYAKTIDNVNALAADLLFAEKKAKKNKIGIWAE